MPGTLPRTLGARWPFRQRHGLAYYEDGGFDDLSDSDIAEWLSRLMGPRKVSRFLPRLDDPKFDRDVIREAALRWRRAYEGASLHPSSSRWQTGAKVYAAAAMLRFSLRSKSAARGKPNITHADSD